MRALIMMLFNQNEETYHPILYFESPLPGDGYSTKEKHSGIYRFKSKGHRTLGFKNRQDAVDSIESEIIEKLPNYIIYKELDSDLIWNAVGIPADVQMRSTEYIYKK